MANSRPLTSEELRMWLNDWRGRDVAISVELDHSPGWLPLLNAKANLAHSSDDFNLKFVQENTDVASTYSIGPIVLAVHELDRFEAVLITASEYDAEFVEVRVAASVKVALGDPP